MWHGCLMCEEKSCLSKHLKLCCQCYLFECVVLISNWAVVILCSHHVGECTFSPWLFTLSLPDTSTCPPLKVDSHRACNARTRYAQFHKYGGIYTGPAPERLLFILLFITACPPPRVRWGLMSKVKVVQNPTNLAPDIFFHSSFPINERFDGDSSRGQTEIIHFSYLVMFKKNTTLIPNLSVKKLGHPH